MNTGRAPLATTAAAAFLVLAAATIATTAAAAPPAATTWVATLEADGPDALGTLTRAIPHFAREGLAVAVEWGTPGVMRPGPIERATLFATTPDRARLDRAVAASPGFAHVTIIKAGPG